MNAFAKESDIESILSMQERHHTHEKSMLHVNPQNISDDKTEFVFNHTGLLGCMCSLCLTTSRNFTQ